MKKHRKFYIMLHNQIKNIEFQITRKCNMRCIYCSNDDGDHKEDQFANHEYIEIIDQLPSLEKITLTGGEPSLSMELLEFISKEAKERNISLQLNTNGLINNEKTWDKLLSLFDIIHFSATNTMDKELFSDIRGVKADAFDVINRSIEYVHSCKKVRTAIEIIVGKFNIAELGSLYDFYKNKVDEIQFQPLMANGRGTSEMQVEKDDLSASINKILETCKKDTGRTKKVDLKLWCKPFFCQSIATKLDNIECECGLHSIYVTSDGFVLPCNVAFYSNINKLETVSLKNHSIVEILTNNDFYKVLYEGYDINDVKARGLCKMFDKIT